MKNVIESEKQFHNHLFGENKGRGVGKFYSVNKLMDQYIEQWLLNHCATKKVLEYGCGKGTYAIMLAKNHAQVTGIDISEVAIEKARSQAQVEGVSDRAQFVTMDAHCLKFQENSFDIVCGAGILHHLQVEQALREIQRVLVPGGKAIFSEPMGHNPFISLYRKLTPRKRTVDEHPLLERDIKDARLIFPTLEARYFNAFTLLLVPFRRLPVFESFLGGISAVDDFLFSTLPVTRRLAWSVVLVLSKTASGNQ